MKKLSENTKALFVLWLLVFVSCLIIFRAFIFGDELAVFKDVGSDTLQQYLMQYDSIIHALRDGNLSLWDFTNGFGTSMYALNLFHPLLFLLYLAGAVLGPVRLPALMVFFEIGQIFLAATALFFYLGTFPLTSRAKVLGAYLYGLNGYLLVWGQHYQFGLFVILLPVLLLLAEARHKETQIQLSAGPVRQCDGIEQRLYGIYDSFDFRSLPFVPDFFYGRESEKPCKAFFYKLRFHPAGTPYDDGSFPSVSALPLKHLFPDGAGTARWLNVFSPICVFFPLPSMMRRLGEFFLQTSSGLRRSIPEREITMRHPCFLPA